MKKLALLFILFIAVFGVLICLALLQTASSPDSSQITRYVPSAVPSQPVDRETHFDFVAYGDTRDGHSEHRQLVKNMIALNPELVINTGDLVHHGRKDQEWGIFMKIIEPLAEKIPYYTVRGNHDTGRNNYEKRFAPPNDSGTDRYYTFNYKNVHFIGLDTNESTGVWREQRRWLEEALATTDKSHIVVFFHHPPFSITNKRGDNNRIIKAFHNLFVEHEVNLVIAGHDHLYYRTNRDGVTYVTTGGGGAPLYDVDRKLPHLPDDVWGKYHHIVHFTVTGRLIKGVVIDVDRKIRDSFAITSRRRIDSAKRAEQWGDVKAAKKAPLADDKQNPE
jgi:3',5'-cyclic AMP phosphodiesterase CpdA